MALNNPIPNNDEGMFFADPIGENADWQNQFKIPSESKILSVKDITLADFESDPGPPAWKGINQLTRETFDTTTNADRAIFTLKNDTGHDIILKMLQVRGKPIIRSTGRSGSIYMDSMKRDDDIRKNGEVVKKIENNYIFDKTQVAKISDYWYKRSGEKLHIYKLQLIGSCPWFVPGDWYTFQLGAPDTNEYIDSTVEVYSCTVERRAGDIGNTSLVLREVMENWSKTTLYEARIACGGSPRRRNNQANTVIIGAVDFDGTCDYRCDGTADEVEINAAIQYINDTWGGGEVRLSHGSFNVSDSIIIDSNNKVLITGESDGTIITSSKTTGTIYYIEINDTAIAIINNITIDGENINRTGDVIAINCLSTGNCKIYNVNIKNITVSGNGNSVCGIFITGSGSGYTSTFECNINNLISIDADSRGIWQSDNVYSCIIYNLSAPSSAAHGIELSKRCQKNRVFGLSGSSTNNYINSYADAGTSNPCADTAAGGYNSSS